MMSLIKEIQKTDGDCSPKNAGAIKRACFIYYMVFSNSALLYREAKALAEKGFKVDIIDLRKNPEDPKYESFHGLNLYHIQARPVAEQNCMLYFFRMAKFIIKATLLLSYWGIKKRYAVIHVTAPPDIMVLTAMIPKLLGGKIILDIHDIGPELYMRKLSAGENDWPIKMLKYFEKISARFSDHVITVTDFWRERLISRSVTEDKCTVLLNVPDTDLFRPLSRKLRQNYNSFNLFYHGSLEEHFGVDTMLDAMTIIKKHIPVVKLHIYGGGRLDGAYKAFAENHDLNGSIQFYDKVPFYQLPQILSEADVGIVPTKDSVFSEETVSMKSFEYIFLGIPIVISRTKAHDYYYDNNMVKFFEPGNKHELAEAVISLYKNKGEKEKLVTNSQPFVQKYSWEQSKQLYYQIVDRIISSSNH